MAVKKRIICIVMIAVMIVMYMPAQAFAKEDNIASGMSGTCKWVIDADGNLTIYEGELSEWNSEIETQGPEWQPYLGQVTSVKFSGHVKAKTCYRMFDGYLTEMTEIHIKSIDFTNLDTSNVTNMDSMLRGWTGVKHLDIRGLDTSNVTRMCNMFEGFGGESIDLSNMDTSKVTHCGSMFHLCKNLKHLDLSTFDTSNLFAMSYMFDGCESLEELDLSNFNTPKVEWAECLFRDCSNLKTLNISSLDVSKAIDFTYTDGWLMFSGCKSLKKVTIGKGFGGKAEFPVDMYDESDGTEYAAYSRFPEKPGHVFLVQKKITRKYTIGKDTWAFKNCSTGPLDYKDFRKFLGKLLSRAFYLKYKDGFEGTCFGFSALIPCIMEHNYPFSAGSKDIHEYQYSKVKEWLDSMQLYQMCLKAASTERINTGNLNGLYKAIKKEMSSDGEPVVISLVDHEVLATSLIKDTPEEVVIGIYDSNYPDNIQKNTETGSQTTVYSSLRLYGQNESYTKCLWGISLEEDGELIQSVDITKKVSFDNDYYSSFRNHMEGAEFMDASYGLISLPRDLDYGFITHGTFDPVETILINIKSGNTGSADNNLYWISTGDGTFNIPGLKAGNEVVLTLNNKSISITPEKDTDIVIQMSEDDESAKVTVNSDSENEVTCNYTEELTDGRVVETAITAAGGQAESISIGARAFSAEGVTQYSVNTTEGDLDDNAEMEGQNVFQDEKKDLDQDEYYSAEIPLSDDSDPDSPSESVHTHSYGKWTTKKVATELAAGIQVRKCSVCGKIETKAVAKLKPSLKAVKILAPKAAKKAVTVKWKKIKKNDLKRIKKVEIQYSTDKNFKKNVKTKYAKASKTAYKIKNLKKGKKYYIRIRAYTKSGGKVHISKWSAVKKVKVK